MSSFKKNISSKNIQRKNKLEIKNIKVKEINLFKNETESFKKCKKYLPNIKSFLPESHQYEVRIDLYSCTSDLANCIRRALLIETPVKSLHYNEYKDTDISDPYILSDFLKKQIELIPIHQEYDYENIKISIELENKTDEIIDITTNHFNIYQNEKKIPVNQIMSDMILIHRLRPNEYLKIHNIKIIEGIAKNNAAAFAHIANIYYEPLDIKPLIINTDAKNKASVENGTSALVSNPSKFRIGYTTYRNFNNPLQPIINTCNVLIYRLKLILENIKDIKNTDMNYYSDIIQIESKGDIREIQIKNESWTITNVICRYCYELTNKNISFICPSIIHPESETGVIKIIHPECIDLIRDSIHCIIEDINILYNDIIHNYKISEKKK